MDQTKYDQYMNSECDVYAMEGRDKLTALTSIFL